MGPHAENAHGPLILPAITLVRVPEHLVCESALEVDASGVNVREIALERPKGRLGDKGIALQCLNEPMRLFAKLCGTNPLQVLYRLSAKLDALHPCYSTSSIWSTSSRSFSRAARILSVIPGMLCR